MEQVVLEVKDLKFKYRDAKKRVLNGLNFQVKKGEFLCIIGQNGSGKSTLCNALVGLIPYYFAGKLKGQRNWRTVWVIKACPGKRWLRR